MAMADSAAAILSAALNLPESERLVILEGLLAATPAPGVWDADDPRFVEELKRRSADGSPGVPWEEVKRRLGRARK